MLAKKHRLNLSLEKNSSIFRKENSLFFVSENFLAYLRPNQIGLQIACLTSKTALSKATLRNFYRRFIYYLVEEKLKDSTLLFSHKFDLVIVLKRTFSTDKNVLKDDFKTLIQKIENKINSIHG